MSRRNKILIISILLIIITAIFLSMYVLNIYGDIIVKYPENLYADHTSTIKIEAVPINAFGWKIPFRKSRAEFDIIEGENLVDVIQKNEKDGLIILRAKGIPGKVEISVKTKFSLFPNLVTVEIFALTG